jgi:predicted 3-demethylubiquinone-9 3-methyltransferase (glyoxalase superfamily)
MKIAKNTICLWYDKDAEAAARFYAETFPNSSMGAVHRAPSDYPSGKAGDVLMVEFTVAGVPCLGLNGGPAFKHSEAFSFQIATDDQQETDRYWDAIVCNGGQESACGWCKDKWGMCGRPPPRKGFLSLRSARSGADMCPACSTRRAWPLALMRSADWVLSTPRALNPAPLSGFPILGHDRFTSAPCHPRDRLR